MTQSSRVAYGGVLESSAVKEFSIIENGVVSESIDENLYKVTKEALSADNTNIKYSGNLKAEF